MFASTDFELTVKDSNQVVKARQIIKDCLEQDANTVGPHFENGFSTFDNDLTTIGNKIIAKDSSSLSASEIYEYVPSILKRIAENGICFEGNAICSAEYDESNITFSFTGETLGYYYHFACFGDEDEEFENTIEEIIKR